MKSNVDLTENQAFRTAPEPLVSFKSRISPETSKLQYEILGFSGKVGLWKFEGILLKKDIELANFGLFSAKKNLPWQLNYNAEQICEYCGKKINRIPWKNNWCDCSHVNYTSKIPWEI